MPSTLNSSAISLPQNHLLKQPSLEAQQQQQQQHAISKKISLYKTELCRTFEETGYCRYGLKCQFAHDLNELRTVNRHPRYKTEICKTFWEMGNCPYGKRCCFIHTEKPTDGSPGDLNNSVKKSSNTQPIAIAQGGRRSRVNSNASTSSLSEDQLNPGNLNHKSSSISAELMSMAKGFKTSESLDENSNPLTELINNEDDQGKINYSNSDPWLLKRRHSYSASVVVKADEFPNDPCNTSNNPLFQRKTSSSSSIIPFPTGDEFSPYEEDRKHSLSLLPPSILAVEEQQQRQRQLSSRRRDLHNMEEKPIEEDERNYHIQPDMESDYFYPLSRGSNAPANNGNNNALLFNKTSSSSFYMTNNNNSSSPFLQHSYQGQFNGNINTNNIHHSISSNNVNSSFAVPSNDENKNNSNSNSSQSNLLLSQNDVLSPSGSCSDSALAPSLEDTGVPNSPKPNANPHSSSFSNFSLLNGGSSSNLSSKVHQPYYSACSSSLLLSFDRNESASNSNFSPSIEEPPASVGSFLGLIINNSNTSGNKNQPMMQENDLYYNATTKSPHSMAIPAPSFNSKNGNNSIGGNFNFFSRHSRRNSVSLVESTSSSINTASSSSNSSLSYLPSSAASAVKIPMNNGHRRDGETSFYFATATESTSLFENGIIKNSVNNRFPSSSSLLNTASSVISNGTVESVVIAPPSPINFNGKGNNPCSSYLPEQLLDWLEQ